MSYTVLARKYRPRNFESLVGQDHVVRALTHALQTQRLHHAYLFTGTRGIGKTTLSRIFAKALNCEKGITAEPCGQCDACRAIDEDRYIDYVEMDAASNRGVADMEQLLEQAVYAPTAARFKVYMIDEVHMLSNQAFNAMLKTLEEPPEYVKFILATTDPQKIPVTVLSRCLQFNLKQMPLSQIAEHLSHILDLENIPYEKPALSLLAHNASGSMRDALSLTDQAIAYAAGEITTDAVRDMLGALDQTYLIRLLDALASHDAKGLLAIADELAIRGLSYRSALQDLGSLFNKMAIVQAIPGFETSEWPNYDDIVRLAKSFTPEEVQLNYQIAVMGCNELGFAPDEYAGFTMTLLRMLAFVPSNIEVKEVAPSPASQTTKRQSAPTRAASDAMPGAIAVAPSVKNANMAKVRQTLSSKQPNSLLARLKNRTAQVMSPDASNTAPSRDVAAVSEASTSEESPAPEPSPVSNGVSVPAVETEKKVLINEASNAHNDAQGLGQVWDGNWQKFIKSLPIKGMLQQVAYNAELVRCEKSSGVMEFYIRMQNKVFATTENENELSRIFSDVLGLKTLVHVEIGTVQNTVHQDIVADQVARQQQAQTHIEQDIYINNLLTQFDGHIVNGSIKPVK